MVAVNSLLHLISDAAPANGDAALSAEDRVRLGNELVARTLDEHVHNEALDSYGPKDTCRRSLTAETAAVFRRMHEEWLKEAEALLLRVREMHEAGHPIPRLRDLKMAVASTRLLLEFTVEEMERDIEDIQKGRGSYFTLEEVRRELRAQAGT